MNLLAIDPGPTESAWVLYDLEKRLPVEWAKAPNMTVRSVVWNNWASPLAIEMVASYGMSVGASVFETCVWAGRFIECWLPNDAWGELPSEYTQPILVFRRDVKLHLCNSARANDANVRQALIDRWGGKGRAVGLKKAPGPLFGMAGDCWAALAVAVTAADTMLPELKEAA